MQKICERVGMVGMDHFSIMVHGGQMELASSFFTTQLGWKELEHLQRNKGWGQVCFVQPPSGTIPLQLTEVYGLDHIPRAKDAIHLALLVENPYAATQAIFDWAADRNLQHERRPLDGGRWEVWIPDIFVVALELVPVVSR